MYSIEIEEPYDESQIRELWSYSCNSSVEAYGRYVAPSIPPKSHGYCIVWIQVNKAIKLYPKYMRWH